MFLYITRKFPPSLGGMERFNFKLVNRLQPRIGMRLICWGGSNLWLPFFMLVVLGKGLYFCIRYKITCIYISEGLMSPFGVLFKRVFNIPIVVTIHGRDISFPLKIYQSVIPWALRRFDKVICVSNHLRRECLARGVAEDKIEIIPNGVDVDDFQGPPDTGIIIRLETLSKRNLKDRRLILSVGRLLRLKGFGSFIKNILPLIVKDIPAALYLVVGSGPQRDELEKLILERNLQNHVVLLGRVDMDSGLLPAIYRAADIFVMPNVSDRNMKEGFGLVALEACASGLPVIATRVGGIPEVIFDGKNGFLFEETDYQGFAVKCVDLLQNSILAQSFGAQSRIFVRDQFSWDRIVQSYVGIFEKLARPPQHQ